MKNIIKGISAYLTLASLVCILKISIAGSLVALLIIRIDWVHVGTLLRDVDMR